MAVAFLPGVSSAIPELFDLDVGDADRRDERVEIALDVITDTRSGDRIAVRGEIFPCA